MKKEYLEEHREFFSNAVKPENLDVILKKIKNKFLGIKGNKIILITSGGTKVPLEKVQIRNIENFSTGKRGARLCEYFLKKKKKVIFLYRKGTFMPFECHLKHVSSIDNIQIVNRNISLKLDDKVSKALINDAEAYEEFRENLFCISFETIFEYGFYLTAICELLHEDCMGEEFCAPGSQHAIGIPNEYSKLRDINIPHPNVINYYPDDDTSLLNTEFVATSILKHLLNQAKKSTLSSDFPNDRCISDLLNKLNSFLNFRCVKEAPENSYLIHLKSFFVYVTNALNDSIGRDRSIWLDADFREGIIPLVRFFIAKIEAEAILPLLDPVVNENPPREEKQTVKQTVKQRENQREENQRTSHLVVLCAAASDFYIPFFQLNDHKIDSDGNSAPSFHMKLCPKFYKITKKYFPLLKCCIFKLEDNEKKLLQKSNERIIYADMLISNMLETRYDIVYIFKKRDDFFLLKRKDESEVIEYSMGHYICQHFGIQ
ncbi:phosphopantothenate--cysteine ligase [Plasmodium gonderi]|uniref:Phosphopantothenate--cysteine ligase n=1 Tax=Plasmodium gonderi TaxID=77519 RepID=A0A1Y1J9X8_PLAGO|nr:phosphopantothenate--cysteine ligase [Plasmodium gonderi]GAW79299.1 phosphopantothenate--cysteine ligase [Plasmodium gonderi]